MLGFSDDVTEPPRVERLRVEETVAAVYRTAGSLRRSVGRTKDISLNGVYFYADFSPDIGASIQLMLTFPAEITYSQSTPVLCKGTVVRVERNAAAGRFGVAVKIDSYEPMVMETSSPHLLRKSG